MRRLGLIGGAFGLAAGCVPYMPPTETPPLVQAQAPIRLTPAEGPGGSLFVRAGSAYDPASREGIAAVLATGLGAVAGVTSTVGQDLVSFEFTSPEAAGALARVLGAPVTPEVLAAGIAQSSTAFHLPILGALAAFTWAEAGHPYGHMTFGRSSVLPTITVGELEGFRARYYVRGSSVILGNAAAAAPLRETLVPTIAAPATPTMHSRAPRPDLVLVAAGVEEHEVWVRSTVTTWTAQDRASLLVIPGGWPTPTADAFPAIAWHHGLTPDALSLVTERDVGLARQKLREPLWLASDALLAPIRGAYAFPTSALDAALAALVGADLRPWVETTFAGAVHVHVVPDPDTAAKFVESHPGLRVVLYEELVR